MKLNLLKSIKVFLAALIFLILISKSIVATGVVIIVVAIAWGVSLFTKNKSFK
ncbi:hypothetical protein [Clostridium sp. JS66]|uniref:hypothetical protein n=1 Tax=Clostridium sp. JS66 TaxID=3064705 RepID=UPI00298DB0DD|nr:hypothetical protein [Clostridium sp. JS66]WPC42786.1 hypothetical protein Q6H37_04770 [Clostridium sp. JS66]